MSTEVKVPILFVLEALPYPPRRNGFTIRFYPLLQALSRHFRLDLALITDDDVARPDLGDLYTTVNRIFLVHRDRVPTFGQRLAAQVGRAMPFGTPYDLYRSGAEKVVDQILGQNLESYRSIVWATCSHVLSRFMHRYGGSNLVVDAIDSMTLWKASQCHAEGLVGRLKLAKVRRWETSLCRRASKSVFISPADAEVIAPHVRRGGVQVIPNGVYFDDYHATSIELAGPSIGYLGNMSYAPNIDAVHRLCRVFELLKKDIPSLKLYIVGRDPDESVLALGEKPDIIVTGAVSDIWAYVNAIDVFVLPVFRGAGLQNKLLEILYAGKAAVVSTVANRGVRAENGVSVLVADSDRDMADAALTLLRQPMLRQSMGQAGRQFVRQSFSWESIANQYIAVVEGTWQNSVVPTSLESGGRPVS